MARPRVYLPTCTVAGCDRRHHSGGYCAGHYDRVRKNGEPGSVELRPRREQGAVGCAVDGYERSATRRGLCRAHYQRVLANGDPGPAQVGRYGGGTCSLDGCTAPAHSRGVCKRDYDRQRRARP